MSNEKVPWLIKREKKGHVLHYWWPPSKVRIAAEQQLEDARRSYNPDLIKEAGSICAALMVRSLGGNGATQSRRRTSSTRGRMRSETASARPMHAEPSEPHHLAILVRVLFGNAVPKRPQLSFEPAYAAQQ